MDAVDAARSFAIVNVVDTDAGIACWDSKYHYLLLAAGDRHPHADIDGNPAYDGGSRLDAAATTPNHPEYPAAHGCVTAADSVYSPTILGTRKIQVDIPGAVGGATTLTTSRHYATASHCARRSSTRASGPGCTTATPASSRREDRDAVARYALDNYFQPCTTRSTTASSRRRRRAGARARPAASSRAEIDTPSGTLALTRVRAAA